MAPIYVILPMYRPVVTRAPGLETVAEYGLQKTGKGDTINYVLR